MENNRDKEKEREYKNGVDTKESVWLISGAREDQETRKNLVNVLNI